MFRMNVLVLGTDCRRSMYANTSFILGNIPSVRIICRTSSYAVCMTMSGGKMVWGDLSNFCM